MRLTQFEAQLEPARRALIEHPIYRQVDSAEKLRIFMQSHVFAVWDFMSLLKTLQRRLTCTEVPWLPPSHNAPARFINEIVLGEETDEVQPGMVMSHFELYLKAMHQAGASTEMIRLFTQRIAHTVLPLEAFRGLAVAPSVSQFVLTTLSFCQLPTHQVAAVFLFGREDIIPQMFQRLLDELNLHDAPDYAGLKLYLERHIHVDGDSHGPLARQMLNMLCGDDEQKWMEAQFVAQEAMQARRLLWDGIGHELIIVDRSSRQLSPLSGVEEQPVC